MFNLMLLKRIIHERNNTVKQKTVGLGAQLIDRESTSIGVD